MLKKLSPTRLANGTFKDLVEQAEENGATAEELKELLGRGRSKKGIFEGNLEEGELEIGQVSAQLHHYQTVAEVINELVLEYSRLIQFRYEW